MRRSEKRRVEVELLQLFRYVKIFGRYWEKMPRPLPNYIPYFATNSQIHTAIIKIKQC